MSGPIPRPRHDTGPAFWAHRRRPVRTIPVKVHCEKKYASNKQHCRVDVKLFSSDERRQAEILVKKLLNGQLPPPLPKPKPKPKKNESDGSEPLVAAAVAVGTADVLTWGGAGAGAAAAEGTAAVGTGTALAVPAIAAGAALNPGQARWNAQNQLIQFGVEEEHDFTIHVPTDYYESAPARNVVASKPVDEAEKAEKSGEVAKPKIESDVASHGDPGKLPGGNGKKPIEPPPERNYRTWRQIGRDMWMNIKSPSRLKRLWRFFRNKFRWRKNSKEYKKHPPLKYDEGLSWWGRRWVDIKRGFRETHEGQMKHWREVAGRFKGGIRTLRKIRQHPLREAIDTLNRPGKLWSFFKFTVTNGYAFLRLATAFFRRITGSDKTNPVGSELFDEEYEPYVGIFGSSVIGASIDHYIFGWNYTASFLMSGAWGIGEMLVQDGSGGTGLKDCDWTRSDLSTGIGSFLFAPTVNIYRMGKAAFPGHKWIPWLEAHPRAATVLKYIPDRLAPKRIPTLRNLVFTLGATRLYLNTFPTLFGAVAEDANIAEYYKNANAKYWTSDALLQTFAMTWDPYLRTGPNLIYTSGSIYQSRVSSQYFQIWEGKRFYREPLKRLPKEQSEFDTAMHKMKKALGVKDLNFNNILSDFGIGDEEQIWNPVPEEWYDFFEDINTGYFTHADIVYFASQAYFTPIRTSVTNEKIQRALRVVLDTYTNSSIPHNWRNGNMSYEDEADFRENLGDEIDGYQEKSYATRNKKNFLTEIQALNE